MSTSTRPRRHTELSPASPPPPQLAVVVPVYNEEAAVAGSIRALHEFLTTSMPFSWQIVIADNASTDRTWEIALQLQSELSHVAALHLDRKGRGRALRAAWSESRADVLCYMDVDLSTDLRALLPLVAGLISGHSDVAIGTRLAPGSRVMRGRRREFISRSYNRILRGTLRARFSDAQCGFKAVRAEVARRLLPQVADDGWFFDTELLILAQRQGLRIHEVAVDWVEDTDSRVNVVRTALDDLKGVARLAFQLELIRFLAIGVASTIAYALLYLILRTGFSATAANAIALAITAVANTQANRHYTFRIRGRTGLVRQHLAGGLVYLLALALTGGALDVLRQLDPHASRAVEVVVLVAASIFATVSRYVALRTWVFARRPRHSGNLAPAPRS
jgi:glycosyltransferase involved in cell wall biosynthesis